MPGSFTVKCNGQDLPDDQLALISDFSVDQNLRLPTSCTITFMDLGSSLADQNILPIGAELEVALSLTGTTQTVFHGEVVAHTVDLQQQAPPTLVVRGYDRAHRLQRGRQSRSFVNMTDGDIASKIAQDCGLQPDVDSTSEVYDYVLQNNQTNWEFLLERADRIGYEVHVDGTKLHFGKPQANASPTVDAKTLWMDAMRAHIYTTSAGQVQDVTVRCWDEKNKQTIIGRATQATATAQGGQIPSSSDLASPFGDASMVVTRYYVQSQAEADTLAQAVLDDLAGNAVQMEAEILGDPRLAPGQVVSMDGLGSRFSGQYYVTAATHRLGAGQTYSTTITVAGRRDGTVLELLAGAGGGNGHGADGTIAIGLVTNNKDDQGLGRVKVKLPWLSDEESDWARVVTPSGGGDRGFYWLPEVNDEVLVVHEQGNATGTGRLYVLGGLWNPQDKPPKANSDVVDGSGKVTQRIIKSRSGHTITLDDTSGSEAITIVDKSGNNLITIDTSNNKITLSAQGDLELKAGGNVKVSGNAISVEAQGNCDIKANGNATMQAQTNCEIKANANAKLSGAMTSVEAQANLSVQAQGPCAIKGAIVQLN